MHILLTCTHTFLSFSFSVSDLFSLTILHLKIKGIFKFSFGLSFFLVNFFFFVSHLCSSFFIFFFYKVLKLITLSVMIYISLCYSLSLFSVRRVCNLAKSIYIFFFSSSHLLVFVSVHDL